jgi:outer membrane biosynthesis protein TonB
MALFLMAVFCGCKTTPPPQSQAKPAITAKGSEMGSLTPAGRYDKAMIQKIANKWYELVGDRRRDSRGNLIVEYDLQSDGKITNLKVIQKDSELANDLADLGRQAVTASAPFAPFPKKLVEKWNQRHIKITFEYAL